MGKPRVVYWFRTDLRLHDSPALRAALDLDPATLWPIFTWDPHYVYRAKGGVNRWQYLLDCQADLSASIQKLNSKSKLFILREAPQTLFPKLFKAWNVTHLVFERDTDAYARSRDKAVTTLAENAGVKVITRYGRTLWDSDEVVAYHGGNPTMSITQLQAAGHKVGEIPRPIPAPKYLPDPGEMPINFEQQKPETEPDLNAPHRRGIDKTYSYIAGPRGDFAIATIDELGFSAAATTPHRGGETRALKTLEEIFSNEKYAATFQKPITSPAAFEPQSTTLLSPMLHFGALSSRLFYWRAQDVVEKYGKGASSPPESLTGQLLFRDMYFAAQAAIGSPFVGSDASENINNGEYHVDSSQAEEWFQRWRAGMTGFPFVDALMRQLCAEGWIHHLGRHMVACFLTRGGCYVHWERGADVFEEWLIDHEPACNAGNWQWLSCTAFYSQYYRCYSPVAFGKKWDKNGELIRRWVPELKNLDEKFIYEPWKASQAALDNAGVKIEGDGLHEKKAGTYPTPMFDFGERRSICMAAMKRAYSIGLHGNDDKVKDGTWKEEFEKAGETEMEGLGGNSQEEEYEEEEHSNNVQYNKKEKGNRGSSKHARSQSAVVKEGPMDKFTKRLRR
ncbi:Cryptochrome/photolyase FAD-binding domain-containing protein [Hypoxylon fragiforme]|uniref:Cryptochrome/photolyase FAD-binding domain-containing protein n=1 Tax=Hypoxylon fragiforme TaxID=63214 RepID=UPI0020C5E837|nr:Cryptochrome/photolyase FAD-binding domain-containing protein [Hypoxylon fragiforme]KAI2612418.1 Cryptochrome/photolyase FAD-binding domain-containing protein [Hypoxylon fragiforme]